jgi:hypothetical protein
MQQTIFFARFTGLFLILLFTSVFAHAQVWDRPYNIADPAVSTGGDVGTYNSMVIVNGKPAIVTYNATTQSLLYYRATDADGTSWNTPVVIDATGNVGKYACLVVVAGNPAVAYYDAIRGDLLYSRANDADGTSWGNAFRIGGSNDIGRYVTMNIVNGFPAIVYYDYTDRKLTYVRATNATGSGWGTKITIATAVWGGGGNGDIVKLEVVNGKPAVCFLGDAAYCSCEKINYLRASDADGASWNIANTISFLSTSTTITHINFKVVNGNPAFVYKQVATGVFYSRAGDADGSTWPSTVTVSAEIGKNVYCSGFDIINGNPAISYYDGTKGILKYVRAGDVDGNAWGSTVALDSNGFTGNHSSMVVVNGYPAIAYYDATNTNLKFIRATDADGTGTWAAPLSFDVPATSTGQFSSIQLVNSNPAISYWDELSHALKYVRASNSGGTAWGTPITLDASANVGLSTSMVIANGKPAVAYYDNTNGNLKFIAANDVNGSTWRSPVVIDGASENVGFSPKMIILNGYPAIAYYDNTNGRTKFVRATDSSGTAWGTPVVIGSFVTYSNLVIINGNPALVFFDASGGNLQYIRSDDAYGTQWTTRVTVKPLLTFPDNPSCSIAVINGNPAVAFHYTGNNVVSYVRATDNMGNSWGNAVNIATAVTPQSYVTLTTANGIPAIAFNTQDINGIDSLKFSLANNANGTSWRTPVIIDRSGGGYLNMIYNNTNGYVMLGYYQPGTQTTTFLRGLMPGVQWTAAAGTTDWYTTDNWTGGVPSSALNATIPSGLSSYPTINTGAASCKDITIAAGATTTISGTGSLQIAGSINNSGTLDVLSGSIEFNGTTAQTIPAGVFINNTIKDLTINNPAGVSLTGALALTGAYTPTRGTLTTGDFLTLKSDASGTARVAAGASSGGYVTGNVAVERYVPSKRAWRYITSPVTGSSNNSIFYSWQNNGVVNGSTGIEMWTFPGNGGTSNPTSSNSGLAAAGGNSILSYVPGVGWTPVTNTNTSNLFTGSTNNSYCVFVTGPYGAGNGNIYNGSSSNTMFKAAGALRTGDITMSAGTLGANQYYLVGNPFASPVDPNTLTGTNLSNSFYMWDPNLSGVYGVGGYVSFDRTLYQYNLTTSSYSNSPLSAIQSGQAFMIQASAAGATSITFKETNKSSNVNNGQFRPVGFENLHILLQKDFDGNGTYTNTDAVIASFHATIGSKDIDNYDVRKFNTGTDLLSLVRSSTNLSFEHRPLVTYEDTIYLKLSNTSVSNYRFVINAEDFALMAGLTAVLKDKFLNTETIISLTTSNTINFAVTSDVATTGERFVIYFRPATTFPVNFINLTAKREGSAIKVDWTVASEKNIVSYDIERSIDGKQFDKAGSVTAANASSYSWVDVHPFTATNYYRIRSIDGNGSSKLSNIVRVKLIGASEFSIYPNPVKDKELVLSITSATRGTYTIRLINSSGQSVYSTSFEYNGGTFTKKIALSPTLQAGIYQVEIINGNEKNVKEVVVQ